jgi:hypothetical protein
MMHHPTDSAGAHHPAGAAQVIRAPAGQDRLAVVRHELRCGPGAGGAAAVLAVLACGVLVAANALAAAPAWLAARSRPAQLLRAE